MATPDTDEIRKLFTEIGCIMEDASLVALVWDPGDGLDVQARFKEVSDVHREIGELLARIHGSS